MRKFLFLFFTVGIFTLKAQVTGLSGWNIFLDPGHSQNENMGVNNYSEAHKVLRVGLALRDYLLNETDIDTVYISRTNDQQSVGLSQRTDLANSLGAAWYHSIHSDASSTSSTNTTLLLHGGWRQNGVTVEKTPHGGKALGDIMTDILTRAYRIGTRGNYADRTFYEGFPNNSSQFYPYLSVNRRSNMPSELSEAGFHTNPEQNQKNMNADWKKIEARAFFWSILKLHNIERPPVSILNGIISDIESGTPINGAVAEINGRTYTTDTYESLFHLYSTDSTQLHNGFYYFEDLPYDSLQLIVRAYNYLPDTSMVAVSDTFFTFKDVRLISSQPPYVASTSPSENDSIYPGKNNIQFNFSRKMNRDSVEANLKITPSAKLTFAWGNFDKTITVRCDSLEFSTDYTIQILPNAVDAYDNLFDGNGDGTTGDTLVFNFRTKQLDQGFPKIISSYPSDIDNTELQPIIKINFDESINFSGVQSLLSLVKVSDQSSVSGNVRHYVINDKSVLHFFPKTVLEPSTEYQFNILHGIKDAFGNQTISDTSINFKTGEIDFEVKNIDNFETGLVDNWWQPANSGSTVGVLPDETSIKENFIINNLITGSIRCMQLNYAWDPAAGSWFIREYLNTGTPRSITFDASYTMQVYVFGDGSNNQFRFAVDDKVPAEAGANHEVSPWYTIDWTGWKLVSWDMANDGTGTWIGDGNLDGTLRFDSFQLTYNQTNGLDNGVILFDDLRVSKNVVVGVDEDETVSGIPASFDLAQNYPNPFNPTTVIKYKISKESFTELKVYDILGREIATLVNEVKSPGVYKINFDGSNLASGIYFYKINAGKFSKFKKMMLVK